MANPNEAVDTLAPSPDLTKVPREALGFVMRKTGQSPKPLPKQQFGKRLAGNKNRTDEEVLAIIDGIDRLRQQGLTFLDALAQHGLKTGNYGWLKMRAENIRLRRGEVVEEKKKMLPKVPVMHTLEFQQKAPAHKKSNSSDLQLAIILLKEAVKKLELYAQGDE